MLPITNMARVDVVKSSDTTWPCIFSPLFGWKNWFWLFTIQCFAKNKFGSNTKLILLSDWKKRSKELNIVWLDGLCPLQKALGNWWCRNSHQWDVRSLRSRVTYTWKENKNTLQKAPVWSRPNTLWRLSQKSSYNSRVLERGQLCVPWCEEDAGAFIVVRSCLLSL